MSTDESNQNECADREGDLEEKALYLEFRETLRSLEDLV
jgi:hypothetical protein